jgi:F-type H+-transporting ATPase subunit epsilon
MSEFILEILSPDGLAFKGAVLSITFPTAAGIIVVLPGHANLVSVLKQGDIIIAPKEGGIQKIAVTGGFLEVSEHTVNVLTSFAVISDESNKQKIEQASQFAKELQQKRKDGIDISVIENQLRKEVSNLKSGIRRKV